MIPKVIHYCWFGGNAFSEKEKMCLDSWKKKCPDYEIKRWDETNFDLNCCDYVKEAVKYKKWAFVSDYARFWILYNYGGVYLDTDVELIKSLDSLVENGPFAGFEADSEINCDKVAPGLGLGAMKGLEIFKEVLESYEKRHYVISEGVYDNSTVVSFFTSFLKRYGLTNTPTIQNVAGITIYPSDYLCPMNYETGDMNITDRTVSIHHYSSTWLGKYDRMIMSLNRKCIKRFGNEKGKMIANFANIPLRFLGQIDKLGLKGTILYIINRKSGENN